MATQAKDQYNGVATKYDSIEDLPVTKLESQLLAITLGDCSGLKILDLGGGSGLHAREALNYGAESVDVVDISAGMLEAGKQAAAAAEVDPKRLSWHVADVSKPEAMSRLPLRLSSYDVVMANWVFDHASSLDELEGMWQSVAAYVKPNGRYIGIRVRDPQAECLRTGAYGVSYHNFEEFPGGIRYIVLFSTEPQFGFEGTSMDENTSLSTRIPEKLGFTDFAITPWQKAELVSADPDFWKLEPYFAVVSAKKA